MEPPKGHLKATNKDHCYDGFMSHYFYLARCSDHSLYAGTCVDVKAREAKHNDGTGAKYTRSRLPIAIIYSEEFETLSEARSREAIVKGWTKEEKETLIKVGEKSAND